MILRRQSFIQELAFHVPFGCKLLIASLIRDDFDLAGSYIPSRHFPVPLCVRSTLATIHRDITSAGSFVKGKAVVFVPRQAHEPLGAQHPCSLASLLEMPVLRLETWPGCPGRPNGQNPTPCERPARCRTDLPRLQLAKVMMFRDELRAAGGPARPNCQLTWPARVG